MVFSYEREMLEPAAQWLRSQGLMAKREFPTPWGICDLVGCSLNKNRVKQRLALRQVKPIGSLLRVHLLSLIPDQDEGNSVSTRDLHAAFAGYLDEDRVGLEVARLIRDRFVKPAGSGTFHKINGWMPLHKRLVAVELKLTRIGDALHQAINNLGFADESYVALPAALAYRLVSRTGDSQFRNKGIGLVAVGSSGCEVLVRATARKVRTDKVVQEHSVERFWQAHIKGNGA
jgi:hypothetical protein